jgi:hypothetical protein
MRLLFTRVLLAGLGASLAALAGCSSGSAPVAVRPALVVEEKDEKPAQKAEKGSPFRLPEDQAGKLLGAVLPPVKRHGPLDDPNRPAPPPVPLPRFAELPSALPSSAAGVTQLPAPPRRETLMPRLVIEEGNALASETPSVPAAPSFVAGKRTSVPAEDAAIPPPLPPQATPLPDRVSLDDATVEASTQAVLAAPLPRRETATPFTKTAVPEPFENRRPLATKVPDEAPAPVADGPVTPK